MRRSECSDSFSSGHLRLMIVAEVAREQESELGLGAQKNKEVSL
jgi:hypothetical protein